MRAGFCCAIGAEGGRGGTGYVKSEPAQGVREGSESGSVAIGGSARVERGSYANPAGSRAGGRGSDANLPTAVSQLPPRRSAYHRLGPAPPVKGVAPAQCAEMRT